MITPTGDKGEQSSAQNSATTAPPLKVASAEAAEESVYVFAPTLAQRRFWLLDKMQPGGNPALNMALPTRLHGPLHREKLRRALNEVVARHEAFRTTFVSERGELRQLIAPHVEVALAFEDAQHVREGERAAASERFIREETEKCFDLTKGPLIRARLIRFAENEHLLLLTVHHILTDGWSNGVVLRELCAIYEASLQDKAAALPPLQIQFADYADWQHERLAADDFAWQRKYWRQQLAGDVPVLDLPTDHPRLSARNASGDLRSRTLPPELVNTAKALATKEGASPFMLFLGVFQVLLHRYTGQSDFLITTPSANRDRPEFEPVVGLFVNPLLLRADLRDNPSFTELLARVRRVVLEGFVNQDVPFELLLDEFQPSRLQVNFLYQSAFTPATTLTGGLAVEPLNTVSAGTVYELSASVLEDGNQVRLEMEYNSALYAAETIERALGHYVTLLEAAVAHPAKPILSLPLLTAEERAAIERETKLAVQHPAQLDIRAPLVARVMAKPDAMAVRHGKREMSCAELLARMENARNAAREGRAPSDLDQAAAWVGHWRARVDVPVPVVSARPVEIDATIAGAAMQLRERAGLQSGERVASFTLAGIAATEELGAALLADTMLVYPTPELLADSAGALSAWLERENIAVAFLPAATWNRLAAAFGRKVAKPAKLRLVIATEGAPAEGSFGRIAPDANGANVCRRVVVEEAGTIVLDGERFPAAARVRVVDRRTGDALPTGLVGELAVINGDEAHRIGELARRSADGSIERLGATSEQMRVRGFRFDLARVEDALSKLPGIRHALVRAVTSEGGVAFVAYILPNPAAGTLPNDDSLRRRLHDAGLPDELAPASFVRLKEIPLRTSEGRVDPDALPPLPAGVPLASTEPVRPYLGLQLQLIAIWEEVLGVRGIGIRDDFFDLGGNSLLAMRMLQRAEAACGKEVLPATLFANPTIEHLAGEMARDVLKESPPLLRVHDSGNRTPFFYLHGDLSGGGFYSLKLSRALGPDQPFYVLPPQDIRALPAAPTIEEMAAAHLAALRAVRPHGPYVIGGFCVGGLVAYELAQQMVASGDTVEMLVIIDAAPEDATLRGLRALAEKSGRALQWSDDAQVARFGRWALRRTRLVEWYGMNVRTKTRIAVRELRRHLPTFFRFLKLRPAAAGGTGDGETFASNIAQERDLPSAFLWASAGYRPQPYAGPIALLLSEDVLRAGKHFARDWKRLAPATTVHPLMGSHLECITAHVQGLAQTIERCLRRPADKADRPAKAALVPLPIERSAG